MDLPGECILSGSYVESVRCSQCESLGWGLIVGLSSCVTMKSSSLVGIFSVSVVRDDDHDEVIVCSSFGARFRCTCTGAP